MTFANFHRHGEQYIRVFLRCSLAYSVPTRNVKYRLSYDTVGGRHHIAVDIYILRGVPVEALNNSVGNIIAINETYHFIAENLREKFETFFGYSPGLCFKLLSNIVK